MRGHRKLALAVGLFVAGQGFAQDEESATEATYVKTDALSTEVSLGLRSALIYDDQGIYETKDVEKDATTKFALQTARLQLKGKVNKDTEYRFRFNFSKGAMEYAYGTHWFTKQFGFSIGQMKVLQGGWDQVEHDAVRDVSQGVYLTHLKPFDTYEPVLGLHAKVAGTITLQLVNNEYVKDAGKKDEKTVVQPTPVLAWLGDFGVVQPLVSVGMYQEKNTFFTLGVKTEMGDLTAFIDYTMDMRASTKDADETDTLSNLALRAAYDIKGVARPWVYFTMFNNAQAEKKDAGLKDVEYNSLDDKGMPMWDDNGTQWALGADLSIFGDDFRPFLALIGTSGKFHKPGTADDSESRSGLQVQLGAYAEI